MKSIYLDNAATTRTAPEVVEAMVPYFSEHYGNPSSVYGLAGESKEAITKSREIIAQALGAKSNEIYVLKLTLKKGDSVGNYVAPKM